MGYVLDFAHGFGVLRQSNTSQPTWLPALQFSDTVEDLKRFKQNLRRSVSHLTKLQSKQVATIPAE